jgi:protein-S-isoprenylcysteine O-methyltransferase Ste14
MENAFLSRTVRIQDERGHRVIDTGPYAMVRHPMYVGVIVIFPGMALLLGSGWGALAGVILALAFPLRIIGEERMLREELAGYVEYTEQVRYRLIPGVW